MKKKLLFILMMLLVSTFLFANGVKEVAGDETVVKVLSVSADEPGVYRARVQTEDGNVIVYLASETDTACSVPFAQIHEGSVLAVRDNGISTRSIPPQMYATEIRDLTLAAALGAYDFTFAQPTFDVLSEESAPSDQLWDITVSDDPQQRFSYSYGYDLVKGYVDQAVVFRGAAFARGVLDFWNGVEPNRDTERGRRERAIPGWMRAVRSVGMVVLAAAVGYLCARYGVQLWQGILG